MIVKHNCKTGKGKHFSQLQLNSFNPVFYFNGLFAFPVSNCQPIEQSYMDTWTTCINDWKGKYSNSQIVKKVHAKFHANSCMNFQEMTDCKTLHNQCHGPHQIDQ